MDPGHCLTIDLDRHELALREDLSMIVEFLQRVRFLDGINQLANLDDRLVVRGRNQTNLIIGWKHGRLPSLSSKKRFDSPRLARKAHYGAERPNRKGGNANSPSPASVGSISVPIVASKATLRYPRHLPRQPGR